MRVAFLVSARERGAFVVSEIVAGHAARLRTDHGLDVVLLGPGDDATAGSERFDVAVATWWDAAARLASTPALRAARLVLTMEDRLYEPGSPEAAAAAASHELGLPSITGARWIADELEALTEGPVHYVRHGIDKTAFAVPDTVEAAPGGPLRVLITGDPHLPRDGVADARAAVAAMHLPHEVEVLADGGPLDAAGRAERYDRADVVLSLVRVAGMATEPLEGFHRGATCVTTAVTGHEEYAVDGTNALVTSWDDERGTARLLDLLAADRDLLAQLREGALRTARAWPSEPDSTAMLARALRDIAGAA